MHVPTTSSPKAPTFTLGDRLRKARTAAGLESAEFAEALGISRNTVSNAEHDRHTPRRVTLRAWAACTGVPLEWIETGQVTVDPGPTHDTADHTPILRRDGA